MPEEWKSGRVRGHVRTFVVWLVLCLMGAPALAQDLSYLSLLPDVSDVEEKVHGSDETDTNARRTVACEVLLQLAVDLSGTNLEQNDPSAFGGSTGSILMREMTDAEQAVRQRYSNCAWGYLGTLPPMPRRMEYLSKYRDNDDFRQEVLNTLLSSDDVRKVERMLEETASSSQKSYDRILSLRQQEASGMVMFIEDPGLNQLLNSVLRIPPWMLAPAFIGLGSFLAFNDLVRFRYTPGDPPAYFVRGKRLQLRSLAGHVIDGQKMKETIHTPGYTEVWSDGSRRYVPGSSSTTTHDTIFLKDVEGVEYSFRLTNWDVSVRNGN